MGAFKYVCCLAIVFLLSIVPIIPAVRDVIVDFFGTVTFIDSYYIKITFNAGLMPGLISIAILLVGTFTTYCIYKSESCAWRRESIKQNLFVRGIFDKK